MDFHVGWVEARSRSVRAAQNPKNALGFALPPPQPTKKGRGYCLRNRVYRPKMIWEGSLDV